MLESITIKSKSIVGFSEIRRPPISGWQEFLEEGCQFLATASKAFGSRRGVFTPEILYNLVAMAIEKLIMALLMKTGNLPYNHTMHDLVEAMEEFLPGSLEGFGKKLVRLDGFQEICDMDSFKITPPNIDEVGEMLELAWQVEALIMEKILD